MSDRILYTYIITFAYSVTLRMPIYIMLLFIYIPVKGLFQNSILINLNFRFQKMALEINLIEEVLLSTS